MQSSASCALAVLGCLAAPCIDPVHYAVRQDPAVLHQLQGVYLAHQQQAEVRCVRVPYYPRLEGFGVASISWALVWDKHIASAALGTCTTRLVDVLGLWVCMWLVQRGLLGFGRSGEKVLLLVVPEGPSRARSALLAQSRDFQVYI